MKPSRLLLVPYIGLGAEMAFLILLNPGRFTSVDSQYYLQSATNLLAGRGYVILEQDHWRWNGTFPVGYSALIAMMSGLTGLPVLVASKLVNYVAIGLSGYVWTRRLESVRASWLLSFWALGGFLKISVYTWSETVFLVLLAEWVWCLHLFLLKPVPGRAISLFLLGYALFLTRYAGGFTFGLTGALSVVAWLFPNWFGIRIGAILPQSTSRLLFATSAAGVIAMSMYLWMNHLLSGSIFGGERFIPTESVWGLFKIFGWALSNECLLIRDFDTANSNLLAWIGLTVQLLLVGFAYWQLRRNGLSGKNLPVTTTLLQLFLFTAVGYVLILFLLRTFSPFDGPNLRLMAPFTFCVLFAGLLWIGQWLSYWKRLIRPFWITLLLVSWLQLLPQAGMPQKIERIWAKSIKYLTNAVAEGKRSTFKRLFLASN